ncbi:hypothetical protein DWW65_03955 [Coprococcus comes]|uniref:Uncharacterized protein n=1 Tax=Coprococcus comes TaxID=410072 RepID=A0A3R5XJD8_9FIRM|nr:hypothetical protein DWW65_03955 [Coprococcus comes]
MYCRNVINNSGTHRLSFIHALIIL